MVLDDDTLNPNDTTEESPPRYINNRFPFFNQQGRHVIKDARLLTGGMTNRSYLVRTFSSEYVARIPGKGSSEYIDRVAESDNTHTASLAGTTPDVVYDERNGFKITRFLTDAMPMTNSSLKNLFYLREVASVLKKLHRAGQFTNTIDVFARNRKMLTILKENKIELPDVYSQLTININKIEDTIAQMSVIKVPCHNDTTPGNFIFSQGRMHIIDFEYGGNNDPAYDLACLSIEGAFTEEQDTHLLHGYGGNQLSDDFKQRFLLYKPVVEYWTALWCETQLCNANVITQVQELQKMAEDRIAHCLQLVDMTVLNTQNKIKL